MEFNFNKAITKMTDEITMQVVETQKEFIFETIQPYCEKVLQMKIDKEGLKQILLNGANSKQNGHWINMSEGFSPYECSECGGVEFKKSNYCPNCGAKMREEENNG